MESRDRSALLADFADAYARVALQNIEREFPVAVFHIATGPGRVHTHREQHPAFYGSFDWHSCVEMFWVLARLGNVAPGALSKHTLAEIERVLTTHLSPERLATELAAFAQPANRSFERPYGWGWLLMLAYELTISNANHSRATAEHIMPLARRIADRFLEWLPIATYPVRYGVHANSACGLRLALPWARHLAATGDDTLLTAITEASHRWFSADQDYPAAYEPSGSDFLSPALIEAELMQHLLPESEFTTWFATFLPGLITGQPASLFRPAIVSDPTDGQIGHLHGLNLSRAWCWRRLAQALPTDHPARTSWLDTATHHADTSLPFVIDSDYMLEHWLVSFAMLYLTQD